MSTIEIADICLWPKHIEGNDGLRIALLELADGDLVVLRLDGTTSGWQKMLQGKNPAPTEGLKPACDLTKEWWTHLFSSRKGERISISRVRT